MSDLIVLEGLEVQALIGVYDWERAARRPLVFDLRLRVDLRRAGRSDDVADTVDYAAVAEQVSALVAQSTPQLLETLAESLCAHLFARFMAIEAIELVVHKPGILPQVRDVRIEICRQR
jgi:7,8-dihydroneopterin aldolase/epimerase/oxygenase